MGAVAEPLGACAVAGGENRIHVGRWRQTTNQDGEDQTQARNEEDAGLHGCTETAREWAASWRDAEEAARPRLDVKEASACVTLPAMYIVTNKRNSNKWAAARCR